MCIPLFSIFDFVQVVNTEPSNSEEMNEVGSCFALFGIIVKVIVVFITLEVSLWMNVVCSNNSEV